MSQELVISDDNKILALCDLSDNENIMEIKTNNNLFDSDYAIDTLKLQLYYQSKGRNIYLLYANFKTHHTTRHKLIVDNLSFEIYKITLEVRDISDEVFYMKLMNEESQVLKLIEEKNDISKADLMKKLNYKQRRLDRDIEWLKQFGYIEEIGKNKRITVWKVLRNSEDTITKYKMDGDKIVFLENDISIN